MNDRARRTSAVRTYYLDDETDVPEDIRSSAPNTRKERPIAEFNRETLLEENPEPTPRTAPLRRVEDFVPGHLQSKVEFWEHEILATYTEAERSKLLGWVRGVSVHEFIDVNATGTFLGKTYNGAEITPAEFENHVEAEYKPWVSEELEKLRTKGCIVRWADLVDTTIHPTPSNVLPLGVEKTKPRLFWDGRWLNKMCRHIPFSMDSVGKVAQTAWKGAYQATLDHSCGFHHVSLDADSMQYFGFCWEGEYFVWSTLCFGWCSSPLVYHTLSTAIAQYLREKGVPTLAWIDDFHITNFRSTKDQTPLAQEKAARAAVHLALCVFYKAGYFMSVKKCELVPTTRLVYLGIVCDTTLCQFEVPEDKLAKLEAILRLALETGLLTFAMLEKLAGKCTSMTVAVPAASLYTFHMYKQIGQFQRKGRSRVSATAPVVGNLRAELEMWLELRPRLNGAAWYRALHQVLSVTGATDASSSGWGGVMRGPSGVAFKAAGDFPGAMVKQHINVKEAYALFESLKLYCKTQPLEIKGSTVVVDVDNTTVCHAFRRGKSTNAKLHEIIKELFWLQVSMDFTLNLRWVRSAENKEADGLSRSDKEDYVRLSEETFDQLWRTWGGFDLDMMATTASAQRIPAGYENEGAQLPFFSRYETEGSAGVDVFSQDVTKVPNSSRECFGFCFPPPDMVGVVLQFLEERKAHAVLVVPDQRRSWFPRLDEATVRAQSISEPGERDRFFKMHHQRGREVFTFRHWGMRAVEVDFTKKQA